MIGNVTQAFNAYAETMRQAATVQGDRTGGAAASAFSGSGPGVEFGSVLGSAVSSAIQTGHGAEALAAQGLSGHGDVTGIVTAVANAQLALQTTTVLRDRFVQAYQDVMRMSI
ncbi:flagellar hook-basal body complex protein FliE [Acidomonas methanolica]|nr:flagellar hook-basal body complex protein FliE [Acidomonas methanolica]MCQ9154008.1 flagellar hook-basal body complex protein FliE [Acidomonas methanolica]